MDLIDTFQMACSTFKNFCSLHIYVSKKNYRVEKKTITKIMMVIKPCNNYICIRKLTVLLYVY